MLGLVLGVKVRVRVSVSVRVRVRVRVSVRVMQSILHLMIIKARTILLTALKGTSR